MPTESGLAWSWESRRFTNPLFALVLVFAFLFGGSLYLFENLPVVAGDPMYAIKITVASFFAVSLGFILSVVAVSL